MNLASQQPEALGLRAGDDSSPEPLEILEVRRLSKTYARNQGHALDDITLKISNGQFASIIGPSGCGKSTLLKIMAGLIPASRGQVLLAGTPVAGPRPDIGMMFQQATLLPWRTSMENVLLPIEIRGGSRGLGELVRLSAQQLRIDRVFALIFYLSLIGLALFAIVGWVERRLVFWHRSDPTDVASA